MKSSFDQLAEHDLLIRLAEETAGATGRQFLERLVRTLAEVLGVRCVFVSLLTDDPERMRVLALWDGKGFERDTDYDPCASPCLEVAGGRVFHCGYRLQERFPRDPHVQQWNLQSYRGVPLISPHGTHYGHLAVADTEPMQEVPYLVRAIQAFAQRAALELERQELLEQSQKLHRQLHSVVDTAMDSILTIDGQQIIRLFNRAAERAFKIDSTAAIGSKAGRILSPGLGQKLMAFMKSSLADRIEQDQLWIPEGLTAVRRDGTEFPVEATVSRYLEDGQVMCTVILRNLCEKQDAREQIARLRDERELFVEQLKTAGHTTIIGESSAIKAVRWNIELVAQTDATVVILGESGTGKELAARAIHHASDRRTKPLITINCAALPENLVESELFGHEKGSFSGATMRRLGRFELADGGTLFLDEIAELPLHLQPKLLRAIQQMEFQRVGGQKTIKVDVRVLAATNRDLEQLVAEGKFREDLFYRLNVFPVRMPPLRERTSDIPQLVELFLSRHAKRIGRVAQRVSATSLQRLMRYPWPGNIRELENVIERSVILSKSCDIEADPLAHTTSSSEALAMRESAGVATLEEMERKHIARALAFCAGQIEGASGAAKLLNIKPSTLRSRMQKLGVRRA